MNGKRFLNRVIEATVSKPLLRCLSLLCLTGSLVYFAHCRAGADPAVHYYNDLGWEWTAKAMYFYEDTWATFSGQPTPELLGTAPFGSDTGIFQAKSTPWLNSVLALFAPRDLPALARFEWRLTGLYLLVAALSVYALFKQAGLPPWLALVPAVLYCFVGVIYTEWYHAPALRGRLLCPLVLLAAIQAVNRWTYLAWFLTCGAFLLCVSQSMNLFFVGPLLVCFVGAMLVRRSNEVPFRELVRIKRLGPVLVPVTLLIVTLLPTLREASLALEDSMWQTVLSKQLRSFVAYTLGDHTPLTQYVHKLCFSLSGRQRMGPVLIAALCMALVSFLPGFRPSSPANRATGLTAAAGTITAAALGVLIVRQLLSAFRDALFNRVQGRVMLNWPNMEAPPVLASILHNPERTWGVIAFLGLLMLTMLRLNRFVDATISGRQIVRILIGTIAVHQAFLWATARKLPALDLYVRNSLAVGAAATILALALMLRGRRQRIAAIALLLASSIGVAAWLGSHQIASLRPVPPGQPPQAANLRMTSEILQHLPQKMKRQSSFRIATSMEWQRNLGFLIRSSTVDGYAARMFSRDAFLLLWKARSFDISALPYYFMWNLSELHRSGLARYLGVRYWIVEEGEASWSRSRREKLPWLTSPGKLLTQTDGLKLKYYETSDAYPKGWLVGRWTEVPRDTAEATVLQLVRSNQLRTRAVVTNHPPSKPAQEGPTAPTNEVVRATVLEAKPGYLAFATESTGPALLVTNEFFRRGWTAYVDGEETPLVRTNAAFLGVSLPGGKHQVVLKTY